MVGGYCASGKSTFSRRLSQLINIPCFNKDVIKEVLGDGFGQSGGCFDAASGGMVIDKGSRVTFLLMLHIAEEFLKAGMPCILESNFKLNEIEQIQSLLDKYNCRCLSFIFKGDLDILFYRYMERDDSEKRHWVHSTAGENSENFGQWHLQYGIGKACIGKTIITDATSFTDIDYDELYSAAQEFMLSEAFE